MDEIKHSKIPWSITGNGNEIHISAWDKLIAKVISGREDATLIIKAVNSHDQSLTFLTQMLQRMKLINVTCVHDNENFCPNHALINEVEKSLAKEKND